MSRLSLIVAAGALLTLGAPTAGAQGVPWLQSFFAPGDATVLRSFTFGGLTTSTTTTFGLYGFDGTHLTTGALWSQSISGPLNTNVVLTFSPNVAVVGGGQYGIGLRNDVSMSGAARADILPNGRFYIASGNEYVAPFHEQDEDGFSVTFDTVTTPEPASLALLVTGLVGLAFVRRRRTGAA